MTNIFIIGASHEVSRFIFLILLKVQLAISNWVFKMFAESGSVDTETLTEIFLHFSTSQRIDIIASRTHRRTIILIVFVYAIINGHDFSAFFIAFQQFVVTLRPCAHDEQHCCHHG